MDTDEILRTGDVESKCFQCSGFFRYHVETQAERRRAAMSPKRLCDSCSVALEERQRIEDEERRREARRDFLRMNWENFCPKIYRESDTARLPHELVEIGRGYIYGPKGLGFIGATGLGKTRSMMLALRPLVAEQGVRARFVGMTNFSLEIMTRGHEVQPWLKLLCEVPILFLDDLGKGKLSEAAQSQLFHVIETRTADELPVFFTSNADAAGLSTMMSEDKAAPLLRRLKEFCHIVKA